jgi:1-deoxy-D-xylulose-5-phosphate reductoisomerase
VSRAVVLLGSTGSVGTQALDIVRANPDRFRVVGLAAGGERPDVLAAQALEFGVEAVAIGRATAAEDVQLALYAEASRRGYARGEFALPKLLTGPDAAAEVAAWPGTDLVLNGITGSVGLILTASGGPFRGRRREELADVTPKQALAHPTWDMGPVVTINSATLVNKGLEVIEAHLLFGIGYDDIDVVVHPQSIVHSMVEFIDGSTIAQASPPDMHLPIALALSWPDRLSAAARPLDISQSASWTFEPLDAEAFPAVALAREVGRRGGVAPAVYNAANEEAVAAFLAERLSFTAIVDVIATVVDEPDAKAPATSLEDIRAAEEWARTRANDVIASGGAPR